MNVNSLVPMTSLDILHNIPFDTTYSDTITFNTVTEQVAYFNTKVKYAYMNVAPIRLQNGVRLPIVADKLYDCNYIRFKNENFGDRWIYAFITKIDWIGVNRSDVYFEIDVIQTWWFDWNFRSCFVEREHITNDAIGNNMVQENIEHGLYVYNKVVTAGLSNVDDYHIILASTENKSGLPGGFIISNIYSGVVFNDFGQDYSSLNGYIDTLVSQNKKDSILAIFMCPEILFNDTKKPLIHNFTAPRNYDNIDGYVPKNKKLFTYPYNFALLSNGSGNGIELRYEYMKNDIFNVRANMGINLECVCYPANYAGIDNNLLYKVGIKDFPMCPYTIDSYSAWLAQNQGYQALNLASTATSTLLGVAGTVAAGAINPIAGLAMAGTVAGGATSIAQTLETNRVHESLPSAGRGSGTGSAEFANGLVDFYVFNCTISAEYAKIIDDYFSMFGYLTNEVKVPNINNRPSWNYVKLGNMKYYGSVPFDDMAKIQSIFMNGITLWHGDYVGDYSRNNQPS